MASILCEGSQALIDVQPQNRRLKKDNMQTRRKPSGKTAVNQNHPTASTKLSTPATRESPSRRTKTVANKKNSVMCHHNPRTAIAVEAPDNAQATAGVTVDSTGIKLVEAVVPTEIPLLVPALPPLWNA